MDLELTEVEFSTKPASTIDKSKLPKSSFLIASSDEKKDWHLPYKDNSGAISVPLLRAIRVIISSGQFRGRKPSFSIPDEVKTKANKLWSQWQKKKEAMASSIDPEAVTAAESEEFDYLNTAESKAVELDTIEADLLGDFMVIESVDTEKGTGVLTMLTEGFSLNGRLDKKSGEFVPRYYSKKAVEDVASLASQRPKIYAGHELDERKRMDRPIQETVAIVLNGENGKRQSWTETNKDGKLQAKAKIRFSEYQVGQETMREAKKDPDSVRASINARVYAHMDAKQEGRRCDSVEAGKFLFSTDIVSYDAAGGHMDSAEGVMVAEANGCGWYGAVLESASKTDSSGPDFSEAFKSLKERLKEQNLREKFWQVQMFYNSIVREIIFDKNGEYPKIEEKKKAFDEGTEQYKEALFELDLGKLKASFEESGFVLPSPEDKSTESHQQTTIHKETDMFENVEQAAADSQVQKKVLAEATVEFDGKKITIAEAVSELTTLKAERKREQERREAEERKEGMRKRCTAALEAAVEELKLGKDWVSEGFKQQCAGYEDDDRPEFYESLTDDQKKAYLTCEEKVKRAVKDRQEDLEAYAKKNGITQKKIETGNSRSIHQDRPALESDDKDGPAKRGDSNYLQELGQIAARAR